MYRGDLHRVPDVPRVWEIPPQPLPPRRFKSLLSRRSSSLSRLNPNPSPKPNPNTPSSSASLAVKLEPPEDGHPPPTPRSELPSASGDPASDANVKMEVMASEKAERKKELEKKLSGLNERKHFLVQMLKQILHAEEEMKRRIVMHSVASRSSIPSPAESSFDQGSAGRHAVSKLSVEVSSGVDPGGELELNQHSLGHLQQIPCASPSASLARSSHGPFQRNPAFQSPRVSPSGMGNIQATSNMLVGGSSVTASPRLPSSQQGTSSVAAVSGTHS